MDFDPQSVADATLKDNFNAEGAATATLEAPEVSEQQRKYTHAYGIYRQHAHEIWGPSSDTSISSNLPWLGSAQDVHDAQRLEQARQSMAGGKANDADIYTLAQQQAKEEYLSSLGTGQRLGRALSGIPALATENLAAPGGGKAATFLGKAAQFVGNRAAGLPLSPSMWLKGAAERSEQQGGSTFAAQNLVPATETGLLQSMVLGSVGHWTRGIAKPATRFLAGVGVGGLEMQGADVAASVLDEALPEAYKTKTKYGLIGHIIRGAKGEEGEWGQALQKATIDAVTLSAFHALHGNPYEAKETTKKIKEALDSAKTPEEAVTAVNQIGHESQISTPEPSAQQAPETTQPPVQPEVGQEAKPTPQATREPATSIAEPSAWLKEAIARHYGDAQHAGVVKEILDRAASGETGTAIARSLKDRFAQAGVDANDAKAIVNSVRSRHGVPSMDEGAAFAEWRNRYLQQTKVIPEPSTEQVETMREALKSLGMKSGKWSSQKVMEEAGKLDLTGFAPKEEVQRQQEEAIRQQLTRSKKWPDVGNTAAFEEAQAKDKQPSVAVTDVDRLGKLPAERGDAVVRAKIDALRRAGLEPYHQGQDEFLVRGESANDLKAKLDAANKELLETQGMTFTAGFGKNANEAFEAMREAKNGRKPSEASDAKVTQARAPLKKQGANTQRAEAAVRYWSENNKGETWKDWADQRGIRFGAKLDAYAKDYADALENAHGELKSAVDAARADAGKSGESASLRPAHEQALHSGFQAGQAARETEDARTSTAAHAPPETPAAVPQAAGDIVGAFKGMAGAISANLRSMLRESVEKTGKLPSQEKRSSIGLAYEAAVSQGKPRSVETLNEILRQQEGAPLTEAERSVAPTGGQEEASNKGPALKATALKNAQIDKERAKQKLPPLMAAARRANPEIWDKAMALLERDPEASKLAVERINTEERPPNKIESALLLHRKIALDNESKRAAIQWLEAVKNKAPLSAEELDGMAKRVDDLRSEQNALDRTIRMAGNELGWGLQFRRQFAKEDFTLEAMMRRAEAAKGKPLSPEEQTKIIELQQRIEKLQGDLEAAETKLGEQAGKTKGKEIIGTEAFKEWQKQQSDLDRAKGEESQSLDAWTKGRRTWGQYIGDLLIKVRQNEVISSPTTLAKILMASGQRIALRPFENLAGEVWSRLPIISKIAGMAPSEGRSNWMANYKGIASGLTDGFRDAWQKATKGGSDLDVQFGKERGQKRGWLDVQFGIHDALKAPAQRAAYTESFERRIDMDAKAGKDVTSPAALLRLQELAYKDGLAAKFQQDNWLVDRWNKFTNDMRKPDQPIASQVLGTGLKLLTPVVRIPTNLAFEVGTHMFGVGSGTGLAMKAWMKGIQNLKPAEADQIMRHFKKGTLGVALFAVGYANPQTFGGYYSGKRRDDDVPAGGMRLFGVTIPAWMTHIPALQVLQVGATFRRQADNHNAGPMTGAGAALAGVAEEIPLVREMKEGVGLASSNAKERGWYIGETAKSFAVPQLVQWVAGRMDVKPGQSPIAGDVQKRKEETVGEHLQSGIPGLRNRLPARR